MRKSNNHRMLQQLAFHTQQTLKTTSTQDLDHEMYALDPGETPSHTLTWKPLGFLSHIKRRTNDDRFSLSLWEVWLNWFCSSLGVPIPVLIGPSQ